MQLFKKVLASGIALVSFSTASSAPRSEIAIRVLSGPPDMVTGGEALVELSGLSVHEAHVSLNAQDVTNQFRPGRTRGTLLGKIDRLKTGKNVLEVIAGRRRDRLRIVNHPITGPVFSGPHQTPFICETSASGLGAPSDADCSAKKVVRTITGLHHRRRPMRRLARRSNHLIPSQLCPMTLHKRLPPKGRPSIS